MSAKEAALALTTEQKQNMESAVASYVDKVLFDVAANKMFLMPQENKLAFLQVTRPSWKKSRAVGGKFNDQNQWVEETADYIPIRKCERLLNFLFNFDWESKVIKEHYESIEKPEMKYDKKAKKKVETGKIQVTHDAFVIVEFKCKFFGEWRTKTVSGSWKMYDNPAISKFAVVQAAISQATKNFAKLYGIGADLNDDIEDRFAEKAAPVPEEEKDSEVAMDGLLNDFKNNAQAND